MIVNQKNNSLLFDFLTMSELAVLMSEQGYELAKLNFLIYVGNSAQ